MLICSKSLKMQISFEKFCDLAISPQYRELKRELYGFRERVLFEFEERNNIYSGQVTILDSLGCQQQPIEVFRKPR